MQNKAIETDRSCGLLLGSLIMLNDLKSHSQACLCIHVHTHHRVTHSNDLRKVINPRDIPVVTVHNFTKIAIPHPLPFKLKTMSQIFPSPGAENPIHPLVGPGVYPRGKPMTCA